MAERSTSRPAANSAGHSNAPALLPQGSHAGKSAMPLGRPVVLVGSGSRAHLHLVSSSVSKAHALIVNADEGSYIRDLASRTHVLVNGKGVKETGLNDQ